MHDKHLSEKLYATLVKLDQRIMSIGPTPLRQTMDASRLLCNRLLNIFDQDKFESDEEYAEAWYKLNTEVNEITKILADRAEEISNGIYHIKEN